MALLTAPFACAAHQCTRLVGRFSIGHETLAMVPQNGSPRWFYEASGRWLPWIAAPLCCCWVSGLLGPGFRAGRFQAGRQFPHHLSACAGRSSRASYYVMAVAGAIRLIWRMKLADMVMKSAAPIGAALTFAGDGRHLGQAHLGHLLGGTHASPMLILFFLYPASLPFSRPTAIGTRPTRQRDLALVTSVNIPIIYKSVDCGIRCTNPLPSSSLRRRPCTCSNRWW